MGSYSDSVPKHEKNNFITVEESMVDIDSVTRKTRNVGELITTAGAVALIINLMKGSKFDHDLVTSVDFPLDNSVRGIVNIAGITTVILGIALMMLAPCLVQKLSQWFGKSEVKPMEHANQIIPRRMQEQV
jgi:hypothetical protein